MEEHVLEAEIDQIVILTLNRPDKRNALNRPLLESLCAKIESVSVRRDVRAVVFAGAGDKAFCAGADLKERAGMLPEEVRSFLRLIRGTMDLIEGMPMPTIAAIEGYAFGGGCELALACDFRILGENATIGLTECALGIVPGAGGTQRLPRLIGPSMAKEFIFTAKRLGGQEAKDCGLCNRLVAPGQCVDESLALGREISKCAPLAVEAAKAAIDGGLSTGIQEGLVLERRAYEVTLYTEDRVEALNAFREKRSPRFQGK